MFRYSHSTVFRLSDLRSLSHLKLRFIASFQYEKSPSCDLGWNSAYHATQHRQSRQGHHNYSKMGKDYEHPFGDPCEKGSYEQYGDTCWSNLCSSEGTGSCCNTSREVHIPSCHFYSVHMLIWKKAAADQIFCQK